MKEKLKDRIIPMTLASVNQANIAGSAAEMSYYFLLSLFPLLMMIANIIPMLPFDPDSVVGLLETLLPDQVEPIIVPTLESYLSSDTTGALSVSFILILWSGSTAFGTVQNILNRTYGITDKPNFIISRLFSFAIAFVLVIFAVALSVLFVFGQTLLEAVNQFIDVPMQLFDIFTSVKWPILLLVLILVFTFIYQFIPHHKYPLKFAVPGAVVATLLSAVLSSGFSFYVNNFGGSSVSNGTIGVFIVLMIYLWLTSIVLIVGAMINHIIYRLNNVEEFIDSSPNYHTTTSAGFPFMDKKTIAIGTLKRQPGDIVISNNPARPQGNRD
ncbi:YihY family inner membrane protein [Aerococcus viridans]|uniref:YihY/virulence factor BrkB family protein n=1 Tax=Aerococcus viridans TaxID=1377 RepID=UPI0002EB6B4D|nr:YihY/virulence factor BrkB family protein [Aerococcus viridans]GMR70078.1 YihY/virulence factor BrkB family protein [Aerococcus viridans]SUU17546.1 YihY family inner membrane protein [Aerococcus viridans]SUU17983.1 YihY family inner membrane protein [Aerococcus viridans]